MGKSRGQSEIIRQFIVDHVSDHPQDISRFTADRFEISRQAVIRHIRQLMHNRVIKASGSRRNIRYELVPMAHSYFKLSLSQALEEDKVWREQVSSLLKGIATNVKEICQYGFTEMLNNVIDHSEGTGAVIEITYTAALIDMRVFDDGIGIFKKIQSDLGLDDQQHAILELSKGKLTTDPERHTGEGIFFTSRMFDYFSILSGKLYYAHNKSGNDWLIEDRLVELFSNGTLVDMQIHPKSIRTTQEIFDQFSVEKNDYDFSRTHVVVSLAKQKDEKLVSRSQAKRLLARFDRFKEVMLDFKEIQSIGQAFADEIFRVFQRQHPNVHIQWVNADPEVEKMIKRVLKRNE